MGVSKTDLRKFDTLIKNTKPDPEKKIRLGLADGLACVVNKGGSKIFVSRYRMPGDKHQQDYAHHPAYPRMTVTMAFDHHDEIAKLVRTGIDPKLQAKQEAAANLAKASFQDVATDYFLEAATELRKRTVDDYNGRYKKWISPTLDDRRIEDIQPEEVLKLISRVKKEAGRSSHNKGDGTRTAGIVKTVLSKIFEYAVRNGLINARLNPLLGYTHKDLKVKQKRKTDHRFLDSLELKATWEMLEIYKSASKISPTKSTVTQILILTGLRAQEAIAMRWSEIEPAIDDGAIYYVPTERMKAGRAHEIYLSPFAMSMLEKIRTESDFVFPSPRFPDQMASYGSMGHAIRAILGKNGGPLPHLSIPSFSPHDLRRSFATGLRNEFKASKATIHEMIAHGKGDQDIDEVLDKIYIKDENMDDKNILWKKWSHHIEALVTSNSQS